MERPHNVAGKKQFTRKQVHLDFTALLASIVDNPVHADRRRLGGPGRIDGRRRYNPIRIVAELDMANFVRDEESLIEARADILVDDQIVGGDEGRPAAIQHHGSRRCRLDIDPSPLGLGDSKLVRRPGIGIGGNKASVKLCGNLPGELHPIHVS